MNKIMKNLYLSLLEDESVSFDTTETEKEYNRFYNTFTAGMPKETVYKFSDMLCNYAASVEENAFKIGFYTAVQLLMGGGSE